MHLALARAGGHRLAARSASALEAFLETMPFRVPLDRPVSQLAAGQKQKLEILKQIYLKSRFLILDEPTSVLTPGEAEEVLGLLQGDDRPGRDHGPHDHPQVPRGDGLRRGRQRAPPRQARRRRARSPI